MRFVIVIIFKLLKLQGFCDNHSVCCVCWMLICFFLFEGKGYEREKKSFVLDEDRVH